MREDKGALWKSDRLKKKNKKNDNYPWKQL